MYRQWARLKQPKCHPTVFKVHERELSCKERSLALNPGEQPIFVKVVPVEICSLFFCQKALYLWWRGTKNQENYSLK